MKNVIIPSPVEVELSSEYFIFSKFKIKSPELAAPYALEMAAEFTNNDSSNFMEFRNLESQNEQAYEIKIDDNGVIISGASETAFIYAVASLLQIIKITEDGIELPKGRIFDYPSFSVRGVNWNLLAEVRGWSQDAADGKDAYSKRFIDGLDLLAKFKLNMVMVDGVGWNYKRFPEYSSLMRKLNAEARKRGIKLCFIGYNAGYGAQWHDFDGKVFKNRKSYPDGEVYPCVGSPGHMEQSAVSGTCLSNSELIKLKCEEIKAFVKNIEPGAMYIHGLDIAKQDACKESWAARCSECHSRWPSNDINAPDGMVGAYAEFYDKLYEEICSVKNDDTGYDAARDCMVNFVSPNYTYFTEDDEEWQFHVKYFSSLSRCIKNKGMFLMLREQFFNYEKSKPRFSQLRESVTGDCKLSCVYFSSGSGFYNSLPVTADAACVKLFEGIDAVCAGSGNAFQEPRQIINAEYMWNPSSPFQSELPEVSDFNSFNPYYQKLCNCDELPENIFGDDGLLKIVCEKLYGKEAGKLVCNAQKLHAGGDTDTKSGIIAPLWNKILPGWVFSYFKSPKVSWRKDIVADNESERQDVVKRAKDLRKLMYDLVLLNNDGAELYTEASKTGQRKEHLVRMSDTCKMGSELAHITKTWLDIFISALESSLVEKNIKDFQNVIDDKIDKYKKLSFKTIDPNGGDFGQAVRTLEFVAEELAAIKHTLITGDYLERNDSQWW